MAKDKVASLTKIQELMVAVESDREAAVGGTKSACRRIRVSLSEIAKRCKSARVELLKIMKA